MALLIACASARPMLTVTLTLLSCSVFVLLEPFWGRTSGLSLPRNLNDGLIIGGLLAYGLTQVFQMWSAVSVILAREQNRKFLTTVAK